MFNFFKRTTQAIESHTDTVSTASHPAWCSQIEWDILEGRRIIEGFRVLGYMNNLEAVDHRANKAHWVLNQLQHLANHPRSQIRRVLVRGTSELEISVSQVDEEWVDEFIATSTFTTRRLWLHLSAQSPEFSATKGYFSDHSQQYEMEEVLLTNNSLEFDMFHWISRSENG